MKAVILAAGYATRLYPLTKDKPKALLPVGAKPLIDHLLDRMTQIQGLDELILVTNHRFYGDFSEWAEGHSFPKPIRVLDDGTSSNETRLGAIGDLQFALKNCSVNDDILVLASDNLFEANLSDFVGFAKSDSREAAVGVYDIQDPKIGAKRYGILELDEKRKITAIEEKPENPKTTFVSMGVYYFAQPTLKYIDEYMQSTAKQDAPGHYVTWLLKKTSVYAFLFTGKWYDIGSLDQLEEARQAYL